MSNYEKNYKRFVRLLSRKDNTAQAGFQELSAAHRIANGYDYTNIGAMAAWEKAIAEWEKKWGSADCYYDILDMWEKA